MRYRPLSAFIAGLYGFFFARTLPAQPNAPEHLRQFHEACIADKTPLWGVNLWGRMVLFDPQTYASMATERDPDGRFEARDGLFFGTLPARFLPANTSIDWAGQRWAMVMLPLPTSRFLRIRLLAHESFHRIQRQLNLELADPDNQHLDTEQGRTYLRLELRALARALRTTGVESKSATQDALSFRASRQKLFPTARSQEAVQEIQEGLAEYTGTVMALKDSGETIDRVARAIEDSEDNASFARTFAYTTGPAIGLLLDRYQPGWRQSITRTSDLSAILSAAVGTRDTPEDRYGYRSISEDERQREAAHQRQLSKLRVLFLDSPTLRFPPNGQLNRSFNPSNLISFGEYGTVYPTGTFSDKWGKLQVDDVGALLSPDSLSLRVPAPKSAQDRTGPGWKLDLAPGWTIRRVESNFEVVPLP